LLKSIFTWGAESGAKASFAAKRRAWRGAVVACVVFGGAVQAMAVREVSGPTFAQATPETPSSPERPPLDELVYADGDRVRGHFVERSGDVLVFRSERFGLLRVPAAEAEVILVKSAEPAVAEAAEHDDKVEIAPEWEWWPLSPLAMTRALKDFFGSWHGRFSAGAEVLQDVSDHNSATVEARLNRKWERDEVQINGRYDYSSVNEKAATDMVRADGLFRHDFPGKLFAVYRPSLEWNRAYYRSGVPSDYVLLQQELGAGVNILNTPARKVRVGVSENAFDTWVLPTETHISQTVESLFAEVEAKLPWRVTLTNRGVWYYSFADSTDGWENRFEISKKLTETLTIGARHETRRNNPDVRSADYERLRLLFGFDF
ncbi:MAG TPA: hypothetical protein VEA63_01845, partial [Opitutus sp.]|nr:hypothetical protein [Opitutus sp.]